MSATMKKIAGLLLAVVMLLSLAACGTSGDSGAAATDGAASSATELNIRIPDSFTTLDPHNWVLDSDFRTCYQVYEPLYRMDDDGNEVPVLATGYTVSDDSLAYTFTLRDDAFFTNGEQLTASDVKFSIERAMGSNYVSAYITTVTSVDADDAAGTVTLNLSEPTPGLVQGLMYVLIANQDFVEANVDENGSLGFNACGTGAYMLDSYTQDVSVTLVANPDYRDGAPSVGKLNFLLVVDDNTAVMALQSGDLDIASLSASSWSLATSDSSLQTKELTSNHVTYLVFNTTASPFDNQLLREAIACAVNRDDIITMAMDGMAVPTYSVVTDMMVGYAEIEPDYTYDVDRAKALLAEAGYPNGIDIGEIQTLSGTYFADVAVVVQQQLAEVGITCTISSLEANTVVSNAMSGSFTLLTMGQTNSGDMSWLGSYYTTPYIGSMNMAGYSSEDIDSAIAAANACMDPDERVELYRSILETLDEQCVYLPLFNKVRCIAWNGSLTYSPSVRVDRFADCSWN